MASSEPFGRSRSEMVSKQLLSRGIVDPRVLQAMGNVPREFFVLDEYSEESYSDQALPIDCEQTISQPLIVAMMSEALDLSGDEHVLEIGSGSGYQAAILSQLARDVISVERHEALSRRAGEALDRFGCDNVELHVGDGTLGWPDDSPYDRIMVTAAAEKCPRALFAQLRVGGILVIPIGGSHAQQLMQIRKIDGKPVAKGLSHCRFVPLIADEHD